MSKRLVMVCVLSVFAGTWIVLYAVRVFSSSPPGNHVTIPKISAHIETDPVRTSSSTVKAPSASSVNPVQQANSEAGGSVSSSQPRVRRATIEERRQELIAETEAKSAVEIVGWPERDNLSELFMPSLRKQLVQDMLGTMIGELADEPRLRRVLEEGRRMAAEDPGGFDALVNSLRDAVSRYAQEFQNQAGEESGSLQEPRGAEAWPYLLAKLDPNPQGIKLVAEAADRLKDDLEMQIENDAESARAFGESPTQHAGYAQPTRYIQGYAAKLYLDRLCADEKSTGLLHNEEARQALQEYREYERAYQAAIDAQGAHAEPIAQGFSRALEEMNDDGREAWGAQLGCSVIPRRFEDRMGGFILYSRCDFILEFASDVAQGLGE